MLLLYGAAASETIADEETDEAVNIVDTESANNGLDTSKKDVDDFEEEDDATKQTSIHTNICNGTTTIKRSPTKAKSSFKYTGDYIG